MASKNWLKLKEGNVCIIRTWNNLLWLISLWSCDVQSSQKKKKRIKRIKPLRKNQKEYDKDIARIWQDKPKKVLLPSLLQFKNSRNQSTYNLLTTYKVRRTRISFWEWLDPITDFCRVSRPSLWWADGGNSPTTWILSISILDMIQSGSICCLHFSLF